MGRVHGRQVRGSKTEWGCGGGGLQRIKPPERRWMGWGLGGAAAHERCGTHNGEWGMGGVLQRRRCQERRCSSKQAGEKRIAHGFEWKGGARAAQMGGQARGAHRMPALPTNTDKNFKRQAGAGKPAGEPRGLVLCDLGCACWASEVGDSFVAVGVGCCESDTRD